MRDDRLADAIVVSILFSVSMAVSSAMNSVEVLMNLTLLIMGPFREAFRDGFKKYLHILYTILRVTSFNNPIVVI